MLTVASLKAPELWKALPCLGFEPCHQELGRSEAWQVTTEPLPLKQIINQKNGHYTPGDFFFFMEQITENTYLVHTRMHAHAHTHTHTHTHVVCCQDVGVKKPCSGQLLILSWKWKSVQQKQAQQQHTMTRDRFIICSSTKWKGTNLSDLFGAVERDSVSLWKEWCSWSALSRISVSHPALLFSVNRQPKTL